jgi:maltose O-acetyltransferase
MAFDQNSQMDPRYSDPFVGAPYLKPPVFIDYGTSLQIAPSTFVNRNFTVIDSPAASFTIGERCLIGPNVTLAGVGHPLGM